ncbi:undecaprenyldiphospho-muramoylpentapeptide beta-N-acetylglucosaminyltransferase [Oxalobacteraceae bacterium CAVE-383]|nr:undecaprenyldiphospho-muramoylpentapeptide beta-N-acetylglucosaminyltransferase [Oxalobacteraceae bacterium CAVE-383]
MTNLHATKRLLIMAAGTGGHIFPGLAIADTMRARGWQVSWLGTTHGMEQSLVPKHGNGIEMDSIVFAGLRGKGWSHTLRGVWRLCAAFGACWNVMRRRAPDVVLGMGGYVTVPGGAMARLRGVPLVLVNADAGLLLSNKMLAPLASRLLFGLPAATGTGAEGGALARKSVVTGNPVRAEITSLAPPRQRYADRSGALKMLVVGGSLGAKVLNDSVPAALAAMPAAQRPRVVHQSGKQHIDALRAAYAAAGVEAEVLDFIDDMPRRYAEADVVLCRAGAITVSELTAAGVASILVPFMASTTSHQRDNAIWMAREQAAIHLPQKELSPQALAQQLNRLTRADCLSMAESAYAQGRRDANRTIADELQQQAEKA